LYHRENPNVHIIAIKKQDGDQGVLWQANGIRNDKPCMENPPGPLVKNHGKEYALWERKKAPGGVPSR
jgi:hypothetical protein